MNLVLHQPGYPRNFASGMYLLLLTLHSCLFNSILFLFFFCVFLRYSFNIVLKWREFYYYFMTLLFDDVEFISWMVLLYDLIEL